MSPLQKHLRAAVLYGGGWAQHLPYIAYQTNTSFNRALKTSPYNMFYGCYPPSILKTAVAYPARSPADDNERQLLAATFSTFFEEAAMTSFKERARTHARQQHSVTFEPGDYVTLWVAHERPNKLEPYVDLRRVRDKVSDSVYIVEHINCDSSNGTDKNQAATVVHVDRIKKIPRPPRFSKAEQKTMTINQTKDGRGVVEEVRNRTTSGGRVYLNIKWLGVTDAEANEHKIDTMIEPRKLLKCQRALEYLKNHGYKTLDPKYGSYQGGALATKDAPPDQDLALPHSAAGGAPQARDHTSEAPRFETSASSKTKTKTKTAARAPPDAPPEPSRPGKKRVRFQLKPDKTSNELLPHALTRSATRSRQLRSTRQARS